MHGSLFQRFGLHAVRHRENGQQPVTILVQFDRQQQIRHDLLRGQLNDPRGFDLCISFGAQHLRRAFERGAEHHDRQEQSKLTATFAFAAVHIPLPEEQDGDDQNVDGEKQQHAHETLEQNDGTRQEHDQRGQHEVPVRVPLTFAGLGRPHHDDCQRAKIREANVEQRGRIQLGAHKHVHGERTNADQEQDREPVDPAITVATSEAIQPGTDPVHLATAPGAPFADCTSRVRRAWRVTGVIPFRAGRSSATRTFDASPSFRNSSTKRYPGSG